MVGNDADDEGEAGLAGEIMLTALGAAGGTILGEDDLPPQAVISRTDSNAIQRLGKLEAFMNVSAYSYFSQVSTVG